MRTTLSHLAFGSIAFWLVVFGRPSRGDELNFKHHFVDRDPPGSQCGQTALVDIDRGDLDLITGQTSGDIRWYEFKKEDKTWALHLLGRDAPSDVGGVAIDVDSDGRVDFVTGAAWYQQPEDAKNEPWPSHLFDEEPTKVHEFN